MPPALVLPHSGGPNAEAPTPCSTTSQNGLSGRTYTTDAQADHSIFERVAGVGGQPAPLCRSYGSLICRGLPPGRVRAMPTSETRGVH